MEDSSLFNNDIFKLDDILYYYDYPRIFLIKNKQTNRVYLFTEVEAEQEYDAWIVVEVRPNQEKDITQYGLYHPSDRLVHLVTFNYIKENVEVTQLSSDSEYLQQLSLEKMPI